MDLFSTTGRQKILFSLLYFSEGAPLGFIWWALPTHLRAKGLPIESITALTSVLVVPWMLKFLWSPLIDITSPTPRHLRRWILTAQIVMGALLIPLLFIDQQGYLGIAALLLFLHSVSAATQDASIDALAIRTVASTSRGSLNGWMQIGMLGGRAILGGGGLLLEQILGWNGVILLLVVLIWCTALLLFTVRLPSERSSDHLIRSESWKVFVGRLRSLIRDRRSWVGLVFALVGGAGFEAVGAVAGPYMIDRGENPAAVGVFFSFYAVAAMMAGAMMGGYLADRKGPRRAVMGGLLFMFMCIVALAGADMAVGRTGLPVSTAMLTLLYLGIGVFTAASYALFMDLTNPLLGATQFSTYMAATNACESWSSFSVGRLAGAAGYPASFLVMACASLAGIPALLLLKPNRSSPDR